MADRTESSIVIAAAPGAILDVIADFDRYPDWAGEVKIPILGILKRKAEKVIIDTALTELKKRVEV